MLSFTYRLTEGELFTAKLSSFEGKLFPFCFIRADDNTADGDDDDDVDDGKVVAKIADRVMAIVVVVGVVKADDDDVDANDVGNADDENDGGTKEVDGADDENGDAGTEVDAAAAALVSDDEDDDKADCVTATLTGKPDVKQGRSGNKRAGTVGGIIPASYVAGVPATPRTTGAVLTTEP